MKYRSTFQVLMITMLSVFIFGMTHAQTHLVLGGEDEEFDAMILRPLQIEEGPDGNLYVLDGGDSFIKVYSTAGEYLRKLAGPGAGPGEFQRTDGATFGFTTDGNLFFTEFFGGHRWLTIMDLNGDLIRTLSPQLQVNYGIQGAVSLEDGGFLVQFAFDSEAYPVKNYYLYNTRQSLVQMDSAGKIISEIVQAEHPSQISFTPNGGTTSLPDSPMFRWVAGRNETVIWADGMSPLLSVFDYDGNTVGEIDTQLPSRGKVSKDDLKSWCRSRKEMFESGDMAWWNQFGRVIEYYEKALYDKPLFYRISAAPEDHLLLLGPGDSENDQSTYLLFSPDGKIIASVNTEVWKFHISEHYLLFFSTPEDGNTSVHAVRWSGAVGESLTYLESYN